MDVEKAVVLLEDQMNFNRTMERGWGNSMIETDGGNIVNGELYANQHKDVADALELAIAALRAGVKDMNVSTMPAWQPLTLEQLRGMEGQKVLIYRMKSTEPLEPGTVKMNGDVLGDNGTLAYHELYLLTWVAFSFPPAHIDREAWEPCEVCGKADNGITATYSTEDMQGFTSTIRHINASYCPKCGRPRTQEAWAELEKRARGRKSEK